VSLRINKLDLNSVNASSRKSSPNKNKGMNRNESKVSIISDIMKKKKITFLKSASLFGDEDQIFASKVNKSMG
jgi:hypothetical protein